MSFLSRIIIISGLDVAIAHVAGPKIKKNCEQIKLINSIDAEHNLAECTIRTTNKTTDHSK